MWIVKLLVKHYGIVGSLGPHKDGAGIQLELGGKQIMSYLKLSSFPQSIKSEDKWKYQQLLFFPVGK